MGGGLGPAGWLEIRDIQYPIDQIILTSRGISLLISLNDTFDICANERFKIITADGQVWRDRTYDHPCTHVRPPAEVYFHYDLAITGWNMGANAD